MVGELFQVSKPPSIGLRTIICAQDLLLFMYLITYAVWRPIVSCRAAPKHALFSPSRLGLCDGSEKVEPREFGRVESGTGTGREVERTIRSDIHEWAMKDSSRDP